MLKTCYNCSHYYTVCDSENTDCHWHDFCSQWGKILDNFVYWDDYDLSKYGIVYDDMETGLASCYMFSPLDKPFRDDEWFNKNREHNEKLQKAFEDANACPDTCLGKDNEEWCMNNECPLED